MLEYRDERWQDRIEGKTRREWSTIFSGLCRFGVGVTVDEDDQKLKRFITSYSKTCVARREHGNAPPIGFTAISEKEFARSRFLGSAPQLTEYRQVYPWNEKEQRPDFYDRKTVWPWEEKGYEGFVPKPNQYHKNGMWIGVRLFYFWDGTGYGISQDYWGEQVLYYRFGCQHEWGPVPEGSPAKGRRLFRCQSMYYCVKCGHWEVVDSSD